MQAFRKDIPLLLLLLALSIPLFFLNVHATHTAGGDDYALYVNEARNLATGKPWYATSYVFNAYNNCYSPPQYPPGYSLLLAPVVAACGIAIRPLCYFNTVVAVLLLLSFFYYFRRYMSSIAAAALAVTISYSGILIGLKQNIVADTTCLLFIMLYLNLRRDKGMTPWRGMGMMIFAGMAILCRTQAILLPVAELLLWAWEWVRSLAGRASRPLAKDHTMPVGAAIAGIMLVTLLEKTVFHTPYSAGAFYKNFLLDTLQKGVVTIIRDNINFFLESIQSFFHYDTENSIRTAIITLMKSTGLVLTSVGFVLSVSRRIALADVFFVLMCGLVLYYPIHDPRYFLPALPIVMLYCYRALVRILPALTTIRMRYIGLAMCGIYLLAGLRYLRTTLETPETYVPAANDRQAFQWLQQHVKENELIICARPRLVALYTDRKCIIHAWQHSHEENKRIADSMQTKYLLIAYGIVEDYYHDYLNNYAHPIDSIQPAPGYTLYTLR